MFLRLPKYFSFGHSLRSVRVHVSNLKTIMKPSRIVIRHTQKRQKDYICKSKQTASSVWWHSPYPCRCLIWSAARKRARNIGNVFVCSSSRGPTQASLIPRAQVRSVSPLLVGVHLYDMLSSPSTTESSDGTIVTIWNQKVTLSSS